MGNMTLPQRCKVINKERAKMVPPMAPWPRYLLAPERYAYEIPASSSVTPAEVTGSALVADTVNAEVKGLKPMTKDEYRRVCDRMAQYIGAHPIETRIEHERKS